MVFGLFGSEKNKLKKEQAEKKKELEKRKKEVELYQNARKSAEQYINQIMEAGEIDMNGTIYKTSKARPIISYKGRNEEG